MKKEYLRKDGQPAYLSLVGLGRRSTNSEDQGIAFVP